MVYFTTWVETVVLKPSSRSLLLLNFLECLRLIRRTVAFTLVNTGFNYVEIKRCVFNGELRMSEKGMRGWNKSKSCPDGTGRGNSFPMCGTGFAVRNHSVVMWRSCAVAACHVAELSNGKWRSCAPAFINVLLCCSEFNRARHDVTTLQ